MEKSIENCKKFLKNLDIKSNFGQNACRALWKFTLSATHLNKLLYFFYFMKWSCLVVKICHFKVQYLDFPTKIDNLQSLTKYMILTLVFMWNCALRGKVWFLFFKRFLQVLTKFSFWLEDWALGYYSLKFRLYTDIS